MQVEIWSDILCPWCYIGKREFENALAEFKNKDKVEITWKSFELDPAAQKDYPGDLYDLLSSKYNISVDKAKQMTAALVARANSIGLQYNMDTAKATNSFDAHRLIHLAMKHGLQEKVIESLSSAYLIEGLHIGSRETLTKIGLDAGLKASDIQAMFESNKFADDVRKDEYEAQNLQVRGVPFFLIDRKYSLSGAQPQVVFGEALEKIYEELYPDNAGTGSTCDADGVCETN